jgi:hypothetical protein
MGTVKQADANPEIIAKDRTRYLAYTDNLMMVVIDVGTQWADPIRGSDDVNIIGRDIIFM